jgi:NAD(P)-dependent dehydrogenase (short-subunit alcohol dehydrogenase family)
MAPSTPQVWLITGSSRGIGLALTRHVLSHGGICIATSRTPINNTDLVTEVTTHPSGRGHWLPLDVTSPDLEAQVKDAEALYGRVDVLVNNAGYAVMGAIEEVPVDVYRDQMETNLLGPVRIMQAVLPGMRARRQGCIINISSAAGIISVAGNGVYSASKFALEAVTEALGRETEGLGIRVVSMVLGAFRTGFGREGARVVTPKKDGGYEEVVGSRVEAVGKLKEGAMGDPGRAAERIWEVGCGEEEVRKGDGGRWKRFVLGEDSWKAGWMKIEDLRETWTGQREWAKGTAVQE